MLSVYLISDKLRLSAASVLDQRETDWRSMWISIFLQFVVGVQVSVYYMSMWPYLQKVIRISLIINNCFQLDKTADVDFFWVGL